MVCSVESIAYFDRLTSGTGPILNWKQRLEDLEKEGVELRPSA
jgi:hypothetical protein